jgi:hypothetical protein
MSETRKLAAILVADVVGLQSMCPQGSSKVAFDLPQVVRDGKYRLRAAGDPTGRQVPEADNRPNANPQAHWGLGVFTPIAHVRGD